MVLTSSAGAINLDQFTQLADHIVEASPRFINIGILSYEAFICLESRKTEELE